MKFDFLFHSIIYCKKNLEWNLTLRNLNVYVLTKSSKQLLADKQNPLRFSLKIRLIDKQREENNINPNSIRNYAERGKRDREKLGSDKPSFWSFSLNSFSKALSIMSAKLPSLGLERDTLDSVAFVWTSGSESPSGWASASEEGTKSPQRRSRVGANIQTSLRTEDGDPLNIALRGSGANRESLSAPSKRQTTGALVQLPKMVERERRRERESGVRLRKTDRHAVDREKGERKQTRVWGLVKLWSSSSN